MEELPTDPGSWIFILQVPHTNNANGAGRGEGEGHTVGTQMKLELGSGRTQSRAENILEGLGVGNLCFLF